MKDESYSENLKPEGEEDMNNGKVILYGMGQYARLMLSQYCVPIEDVIAIIDNSPEEVKKVFEGVIAIFTWEEFVKNKAQYSYIEKIVVASPKYKTIIIKQIEESGIFRQDQIIFINEWLTASYSKGTMFKDILYKYKRDKALASIPDIKKEALKNTVCLPDRTCVLERLPKNLVVAEIGVAYGDFSRMIIDYMSPEKFYAIDIFSEDVVGFWEEKTFEEANMSHLQWYKNRFNKEINENKLEIRQGFSWNVLKEFPDNFFDYVYLDAAHDYDSVLKDVTILCKKVKNGGIIQFNDYIVYDYYTFDYNLNNLFYGIKQVVHQLLKNTNSEVLYYCLSPSSFDDIVIKYWK